MYVYIYVYILAQASSPRSLSQASSPLKLEASGSVCSVQATSKASPAGGATSHCPERAPGNPEYSICVGVVCLERGFVIWQP